MALSNERERYLRKVYRHQSTPTFDGKMVHDGKEFNLDGVINYGPREREHFKGDIKTFEKKMREKGLM